MKIQTDTVQVGDIMVSGEKVLAVKIGKRFQLKPHFSSLREVIVVLKKPNGTQRVAKWYANGTLFIRSRKEK
jgi:hypothetical protein